MQHVRTATNRPAEARARRNPIVEYRITTRLVHLMRDVRHRDLLEQHYLNVFLAEDIRTAAERHGETKATVSVSITARAHKGHVIIDMTRSDARTSQRIFTFSRTSGQWRYAGLNRIDLRKELDNIAVSMGKERGIFVEHVGETPTLSATANPEFTVISDGRRILLSAPFAAISHLEYRRLVDIHRDRRR